MLYENRSKAISSKTKSDQFCKCGCGRRTYIVTHTNNKLGLIKGEPAPYLEPASTGGAAVAPIVMGTSVLIPLNRYNEFVEFESGRSIKALSLFAADIEDTLHAIANIVGIKDRLDPAIIEAVRKLAAQSSPKDE